MNGEQDGTAAPDDGGEEPPEYRVSHLKDSLAELFEERGLLEDVAPLARGGVKPRVNNRVQFTYTPLSGGERGTTVDEILDADGMAWTVGSEAGQYIVLGRDVADLRELRKGDLIHVGTRRGPFRVARVMDRPPEVLQRKDPAVTVELSNLDTDTDWMIVWWKNDDRPWSYLETADELAKGGYRHRKVDPVERFGRIGPRRLFALSEDHVPDSESPDELIRHALADAREFGGLGEIHPSDVSRVEHLMERPAADVFAGRDAKTVRKVLSELSDAFEREASALEIESDEDREHAREYQTRAEELDGLATGFEILNMDAVDEDEDTRIYACDDCGKAFTNRHKFPTHRRECPERTNGGDDE